MLLQRFGDSQGSPFNEHHEKIVYTPDAESDTGDLVSLCLRQLDDIIEMIYALDKIAPGTAKDTLLYGVEVKFYNSVAEVDGSLETKIPGLCLSILVRCHTLLSQRAQAVSCAESSPIDTFKSGILYQSFS